MLTDGIEHELQNFVSPREMAKSLGLSVERLGRIIREKKLLKPIELFGKFGRFWYVERAVEVFDKIRSIHAN
jgi:hypothetical protein